MFKMFMVALFGALFFCSPCAAATKRCGLRKNGNGVGRFEIATSQLALKKSQAPDVKRFAQQMIDDHTAAAQKLAAVATDAGLPPERRPVKASDKHMKDMEMLQGAKLLGIRRVLCCFTKESARRRSEPFSANTLRVEIIRSSRRSQRSLPTLQSHLSHVKTLTLSKM